MQSDTKPPNEKRAAQVTIRPFELGDGPSLLEAVSESIESLRQWMTWCKPDYASVDAQGFLCQSVSDWETGKNYSFAILNSENQTFLGSVGLNLVNRTHNFAHLGYWIRTRYVRNGAASAAVRLAAAYGINNLKFNRLELIIPTDNVASNRVAQKAGATCEGVLRNRLLLEGKVHNAFMYSFAPGDFDRPTTPRGKQ